MQTLNRSGKCFYGFFFFFFFCLFIFSFFQFCFGRVFSGSPWINWWIISETEIAIQLKKTHWSYLIFHFQIKTLNKTTKMKGDSYTRHKKTTNDIYLNERIKNYFEKSIIKKTCRHLTDRKYFFIVSYFLLTCLFCLVIFSFFDFCFGRLFSCFPLNQSINNHWNWNRH